MAGRFLLQTLQVILQQPLNIPDHRNSAAASFPGHQLLPTNDGHVIPSPAFGAGSVNKRTDVFDIVSSAIAQGYRHFDNARFYGNEESVGRALKASGLPRESFYVTTKWSSVDGNPWVEFKAQLKDLQLDYVDLYLIHHPSFVPGKGGIKKVWAEFEEIQRSGLAKSIGVSNYNETLLSELLAIAEIKPAVNQIRHHAYIAQQNKPVIELAKQHGIVTASYSALTPITLLPGGEADAIGQRIADRLSKAVGHPITVGQAIADWLRTTGIIEVTTSSKAFRQAEQLAVFAEEFPLLTEEEVEAYEHAKPKEGQAQGGSRKAV